MDPKSLGELIYGNEVSVSNPCNSRKSYDRCPCQHPTPFSLQPANSLRHLGLRIPDNVTFIKNNPLISGVQPT